MQILCTPAHDLMQNPNRIPSFSSRRPSFPHPDDTHARFTGRGSLSLESVRCWGENQEHWGFAALGNRAGGWGSLLLGRMKQGHGRLNHARQLVVDHSQDNCRLVLRILP
jgi:hypothetical protein